MDKLIDSHIHLDRYSDEEIKRILLESPFLEAMISVSFDLDSAQRNLHLSKEYPSVKPAFGFHPEQPLPGDHQLAVLFNWMEGHKDRMIAIGEVGLPYYTRKEQPIEPYAELLEEFIRLAKKWEKPIVLHAIYEDAEIACELLEKHSIKKAHFHWYKGKVERLLSNGYFVSVTPDALYEQEIQELIQTYPLEQMMVETDGPWPFEGPFEGQLTMPAMMQHTVRRIAAIKNWPVDHVYEALFKNTKDFYQL